MVKSVRGIHNCGEVAPALFITPQKCCPNLPKLEPIIEEGPETFEGLPKRALFLLPVLLSFVSYLLLYRSYSASN
ncbi:hypothetical protein L6164_033451 [Bauhinia variegata]|uniref:Uncharacterized protein n=1 Tax=Bauhinia variegata TaxID=167791 RepID=A0ACB9KRX8_BAUVA|nr:hypothetical protein L6164_033451 [Bauhinia variegata]